jgi:hypothetical protein
MKKQTFLATLFRLLIIILLAGMAQDVLAQRTVLRGEQRNDQKRSARTTVKKDKKVIQSAKKMVRKSPATRSDRQKERYSKSEQGRKGYQDSKKARIDRRSGSLRPKAGNSKKEYGKKKQRDFKKDYDTNKRNKKHSYTYRDKKRHYPNKKSWSHKYYRKPVWVDYHRVGYRYPRIGLQVSVLPRGFFSIVIGNYRFYAYRGVYYRYDPWLRVYVVVNKPKIETWYTSEAWDTITLVDGSTIEGVYCYTENDMVIFEVGDALLEIPMSEIRVLSLSEN